MDETFTRQTLLRELAYLITTLNTSAGGEKLATLFPQNLVRGMRDKAIGLGYPRFMDILHNETEECVSVGLALDEPHDGGCHRLRLHWHKKSPPRPDGSYTPLNMDEPTLTVESARKFANLLTRWRVLIEQSPKREDAGAPETTKFFFLTFNGQRNANPVYALQIAPDKAEVLVAVARETINAWPFAPPKPTIEFDFVDEIAIDEVQRTKLKTAYHMFNIHFSKLTPEERENDHVYGWIFCCAHGYFQSCIDANSRPPAREPPAAQKEPSRAETVVPVVVVNQNVKAAGAGSRNGPKRKGRRGRRVLDRTTVAKYKRWVKEWRDSGGKKISWCRQVGGPGQAGRPTVKELNAALQHLRRHKNARHKIPVKPC